MPENSSTAEIVAAMRSAQRIAVVAHVRPDGDAVGSVLGLALSLLPLFLSPHRFSEKKFTAI